MKVRELLCTLLANYKALIRYWGNKAYGFTGYMIHGKFRVQLPMQVFY